MIGNSNDETNFLHKLSLTNTQVLRLFKAFANVSSANIKLSKTKLHKIGQPGRFLCRMLGPLLKTVLPLLKNSLKPLVKSVLIPFRLTRAASATDAAIQNNFFRSVMRTLIFSNEEYLKESGLLMKRVSKTIKKVAKEQRGGFFGMLLDALGASLLENLLKGTGAMRAGEGRIRADQCHLIF